jgi:hypothetical protein
LGQSVGQVVYFRNLTLLHRNRKNTKIGLQRN